MNIQQLKTERLKVKEDMAYIEKRIKETIARINNEQHKLEIYRQSYDAELQTLFEIDNKLLQFEPKEA